MRSILAALTIPLALAGHQRAGEAPPSPGPLTAPQVLTQVAGDLRERLGLSGDLQLDFANGWAPPDKTAREWRIEILDYPSGPSTSMFVRLRIYADSVQVIDTSAVLRAALWADAWFAREPLVAGTGLDSTQLEARRIDFLKARDAVPASNSDSNLVLTRPLQAGSMVTWTDLGRKPLVTKGDMVDVTATSGLLRVTMKGLALQSGAAGDVVNVRNTESLRTIPAKVVGEDRVEIRL